MEKVNDNTPYDDVYRTLLNDCTGLMIPVVNEMFGEHYTGNEEIIALHDIHMVNQQDGNTKEKITDSCFEIQSEMRRRYHIECQSTPDGSILLRFFEYDSQIALDEGELENHKLIVKFPHSGVLYLRHTSKTPEELTIVIETPGGDITYGIPIMKVQTFTIEEIFEKRLLFLLPFYIFSHEKCLVEYENNEEKMKQLKNEFRMIREKLDTLCLNGEISEFVKCSVIDMTKRVISNVTAKYEKVREEVREVMGGKVLEYEAKTILQNGIRIGNEQGRIEGEIKGEIKGKIVQIQKKMRKNYSVPDIAEQLEETEEYVKQIYEIIEETGIDAEATVILEKVLAISKSKITNNN